MVARLKNTPPAALDTQALDERVKKRASIEACLSKITTITAAFHFETVDLDLIAQEFSKIDREPFTTQKELNKLLSSLDRLYVQVSTLLQRIERQAQQKIIEEKKQLDAAVERHLDTVLQLAQEAISVGLQSDIDLSALERLRNTLDLVQKSEAFPEALQEFKRAFQELVARNSLRVQALKTTITSKAKEKQ